MTIVVLTPLHVTVGAVGQDDAKPANPHRAIDNAGGANTPATSRELSRWNVQFSRPLSRSERDQLHTLGITMRAAGGGRFIATAEANAMMEQVTAAIGGPALVASISEITAEQKISRLVLDGRSPAWAVKEVDGQRITALNVLFHADVELDHDAQAVIEAIGGTVLSPMRAINGLVVKIPESAIDDLSAHDAVLFIEPPLPPLSPLNDTNRLLTQAELVHAPPYNLDGSGVNVMVFDTGPGDSTHPDFGGRLTNRFDFTGNFDAHATHVAGTVGGDGTMSGGQYRGMAPGVSIEAYRINFVFPNDPPTVDDLLDMFFANAGNIEEAYVEASTKYNAVVANNSIGLNLQFFGGFPQSCLLYGEYGSTAAVIDGLARGEPGEPITISWAAGNPGNSNHHVNCGFEYGSISPPSNNKNSILVGAVHADTDQVTQFSARGPTLDGRLKPDIVAPGCEERGDGGVTSLAVGGGYLTACGTSMAAPTVSGLVALMVQDYRDHYPGQPDMRNSTAKAVLIQTAVDMETPGPTYSSGYGSVRVKDAIDLIRDGMFIEVPVNHVDVVTYQIEIEPIDEDLKVTIAWDDPPSIPSANPGGGVDPKLINDIDLHVYAPDGTRHFPWTLDPQNPSAPAVQNTVDRVNNVEQVFVSDPMPGTWTIEVHGYDVPMAPQLVSLAATPRIDFEPCLNPADLNCDHVVDVEDLFILLGAWGACDDCGNCPADLDGNCEVDVEDLFILLANWG